jgi:hypothetical protein
MYRMCIGVVLAREYLKIIFTTIVIINPGIIGSEIVEVLLMQICYFS